ncbi:acyl--CoA ligase [Pseudohalioglobus sediminis]|uniref:Acyl--CoA ligase n=1 Tax=Pseudohalioglobus sediminis TaxID=2606449 RepID=A0A5B0WUL2_9GAMM|nr:class I adenylate-forming enzyme family protein [Pseudohalioglobus sediminis]KAA1189559.1 acyl--CoA ligase [Pseudohalioglobus sediminis]
MKTTPESRSAELTSAGLWSGQTLHELLDGHASNRPQRLAVRDQPDRQALTGHPQVTLTWAQLQAASHNLARQLSLAGIGVGDEVIVQLPNVAELVVVYYALSRLGAVASPVPVQYGAHELQMLAGALGASTLISIERLREQPLAEAARAALPGVTVLEFGRELLLDLKPRPAAPGLVPADANRILSVCWTSGTTGTPKGVPRSHNMWVATGHTSIAAGSMTGDDVLLNPFPLVNMAALGGFLFPAAILGASLVLHHPLDPALFLAQMQDENVTFTIAPPALLNQLAKAPQMWTQFDFSRLRRIGSGSAPLAPSMIATFDRDYGVEIVNFYGSNEGISLFSTPEDAPDPEVRASRFRRPDPGALIETRVADPESGEAVDADGGRGELLIRGATVFDGYFHHDNADVFTADGYFRTGDLVEICEGGNFYRIVGRCKDIINRGGMKISPVELDLALEHHPAVVEAAVCAYPDDRLGEKICACLVLQADARPPTLAEVQQYLLDQGFAKFKLPERIEVLAALPRNPLGKVQRFSLQERVSGVQER